ncbi:MAG: sigma-54-dependent Fis family transcriptional regulator [Phycisphaeraceae bacterium]|nr:sigma-54-dependent Fis family transcriptional regulator [Phycisphaeraceae bacterium]
MSKAILIVEDEPVLRDTLANLLVEEGYEVEQADNGAVGRDKALARTFDLIITDIRMAQMDGLTLVGHLQQICPDTPVIIMTAYGTVESAVSAMRAGVYDYLLKPVNFDDMLMKIQRALDYGEARRTRQIITEQLAGESTFHNLVGTAPSMQKLFDMVRKLSTVKSSVLIVGDSGTGKELFARAIHYNGITRDKPFVPVNCGAIPDNLIESELFGYRRGAFTGAIRDKIGYFEAANHGTLFLDEISTLPVGVQSSLLRVLEERAVVPVGDTRPRPVDLRIIAASNRNLDQMVRDATFREDLLYRLNVVKLELPPLAQRKEDLPAIVQHFLDKYTRIMNKQVLGISNAAMRAMLSHDWPGNVRELENVIERAVIFAEGRHVQVDDLPFAAPGFTEGDSETLKDAMAGFERQHILWCLKRHDYDKTETAKHLGIGISSLYRKLDELNIPKSESESAELQPADE